MHAHISEYIVHYTLILASVAKNIRGSVCTVEISRNARIIFQLKIKKKKEREKLYFSQRTQSLFLGRLRLHYIILFIYLFILLLSVFSNAMHKNTFENLINCIKNIA